MRIAVSGTHYIGKTTLIDDFLKKHPNYKYEEEPYYKLQDEQDIQFEAEPSFESLLEQFDFSIEQLNKYSKVENIIFDRCPIDFLAYAIHIAQQDDLDISDTEMAERFDDLKNALNILDIIIFLPITKENNIQYTEENPMYRKNIDQNFKKLYRDEILDIFPKYGHPKIIELSGDRETRIRKLESYLPKEMI